MEPLGDCSAMYVRLLLTHTGTPVRTVLKARAIKK